MRHFEDFSPGQTFRTASVTLTLEAVLDFAGQYDPQPMHLDTDPAASGPLGPLSASGWHTACAVMRLMVDADVMDGAPMLGLGVDGLRWPNPVRPNDTIAAELEVVSTRPSASKPTHGVVGMKVTARNQNGEIVLTMQPNLWVPRRP